MSCKWSLKTTGTFEKNQLFPYAPEPWCKGIKLLSCIFWKLNFYVLFCLIRVLLLPKYNHLYLKCNILWFKNGKEWRINLVSHLFDQLLKAKQPNRDMVLNYRLQIKDGPSQHDINYWFVDDCFKVWSLVSWL